MSKRAPRTVSARVAAPSSPDEPVSPARRTVVVVPCFNEERRIDTQGVAALAASEAVSLLFVDDGSTDRTAEVLTALAAAHEDVEVLSLEANVGKAEAVRRGMALALAQHVPAVAYYDADLATPPEELLRLVCALEADPALMGVLGSRVARMGSAIDRRAVRHYLGRAYATLASLALGVTVYDTQCGAKVFRASDALRAAVSEPFRSSWAFDVELLQRLLAGAPGVAPVPEAAFVEVPLVRWCDIGGSKLHIGAKAHALFDLLAIARAARRAPRGTRPGKQVPAGPPAGAVPLAPPPGEPAGGLGTRPARSEPARGGTR